MEFKLYMISCAIFILFFAHITHAAPSNQDSDRNHFKHKGQLEYMKQMEDEDVQELKNLKPSEVSSISTTKIQKTSHVNANGKKEQHSETSKQVNKNGQLVERIQQKIHSKQDSESATPNTRILTEIDIPSRGIHKVYEEDGSRDVIKKKFNTKRKYVQNKLTDNLFDELKLKNVVQYLPDEMAEYIYETGDEKTVAAAIENYLELGILNREEALLYLQRIKSLLNNVEEQEIREKKQEQRHFFESLYGNSRSKVDVSEALSDLRDIQELIQRYERSQEENIDSDLNNNYEWDSEKYEYRNSDDKIQNFDNLFFKSSMDGVIYQLAKILFYQSFSINGFEAQESVRQFTSFLEKQIQDGRISRNMERKVFNILTAALTDTLNEHPELVTRRKSTEKYHKLNTNIKENSGSVMKSSIEKKNDKVDETRRSIANSLKTSGIMDDNKTNETVEK